jgi:predicted transcriptional regulator
MLYIIFILKLFVFLYMNDRNKLILDVVRYLKMDVELEDFTILGQLLNKLSNKDLISSLPEEVAVLYKSLQRNDTISKIIDDEKTS